MTPIQKHFRNAFLAGIFAAIPVGATAFIVWYVENATRMPLKKFWDIDIPFIGIPVAIIIVYLLGVAVTSIVGKFFLRLLDKLLLRVPLLKELYQAWKQVTIAPGGGEGMYAKVVLVPLDGALTLGFTSGEPVPGDEKTCCIFVPNTPNPVTGRLYFVPRENIRVLEMTAEEAFKYLISTANYIPPEIGALTARAT